MSDRRQEVIPSARTIVPLWDYGWLDYAQIKLQPYNDAAELLDNYLACKDFRTSFLGPIRDFTPLVHGPFLIDQLSSKDFELLDARTFEQRFLMLRQPEDFTEPIGVDQWNIVEKRMAELLDRNDLIWSLKLTEKDVNGAKAHEAGSIHTLFREFIFGLPNTAIAERLVVGYD